MAKNAKKAQFYMKLVVGNCQRWGMEGVYARDPRSGGHAIAISPPPLWHLPGLGTSLMETVEECWMGSRPIIFTWQVIISMDIVPQASWIILLTTRVGPTIRAGACSSLCLSGVWGSWPLHRMLAISPNPGRGIGGWVLALSGGVGLNVAIEPSLGVVAAGFWHPMPLVGPVPFSKILQFQLEGQVDSASSEDLEGVTHTQLEGSTSPNTLALVNVVNGPILSHSSCTTLCQLAWLAWHQGFGFFCPSVVMP